MSLKTRINVQEVGVILLGFFLVFLITGYFIPYPIEEIKISAVIILLITALLIIPVRVIVKRVWLRSFIGVDFAKLSRDDKRKAIISAFRFPYLSSFGLLVGWGIFGTVAAYLIWALSGMEPLKSETLHRAETSFVRRRPTSSSSCPFERVPFMQVIVRSP